jgi:hypothetical protein
MRWRPENDAARIRLKNDDPANPFDGAHNLIFNRTLTIVPDYGK